MFERHDPMTLMRDACAAADRDDRAQVRVVTRERTLPGRRGSIPIRDYLPARSREGATACAGSPDTGS